MSSGAKRNKKTSPGDSQRAAPPVFILGSLQAEPRMHPATDDAPELRVMRISIGDTYTSLDIYEAGRLGQALIDWAIRGSEGDQAAETYARTQGREP